MATRDRITLDPAVRSGKPYIFGTRITVRDVVEYLAGGMSEDELLVGFPSLTRDDARAAVAFHTREQNTDSSEAGGRD